jgi:hypothetical protein
MQGVREDEQRPRDRPRNLRRAQQIGRVACERRRVRLERPL